MVNIKCTCKQCGKEFYRTEYKISIGEGKYCSKPCYYLGKKGIVSKRVYPTKIERVCLICHKHFKVIPSVAKLKDGGKYCSRACQNISFKGRNQYGIGTKMVTLTCRRCKKQFEVAASRKNEAIYCSRKCMQKKFETTCENCGKKFYNVPSRKKDGKGKYCSKSCLDSRNYKKLIDEKDVIDLYLNKKLSSNEISEIYGCTSNLILTIIRRSGMSVRNQNAATKIVMQVPERKVVQRKAILKQFSTGSFPRQSNTNIELIMKAELEKRGYVNDLDFFQQYEFADKFAIDFAFPKYKVLVECFGDWHHANPMRQGTKELHSIQKKDVRRDIAKRAYIKKYDNGSWKLLEFWGYDIHKDVSKCVDELEKLLK